jgi:hypothetical protein
MSLRNASSQTLRDSLGIPRCIATKRATPAAHSSAPAPVRGVRLRQLQLQLPGCTRSPSPAPPRRYASSDGPFVRNLRCATTAKLPAAGAVIWRLRIENCASNPRDAVGDLRAPSHGTIDRNIFSRLRHPGPPAIRSDERRRSC